MKTRQTFVSNSSSSSFIVGFDKKPKSKEEVHQLMFGGSNRTMEYYDYSMTTEEIAETVFNDLRDLKAMRKTNILKVIRSGWFEGHPEYKFGRDSKADMLQREFRKLYPKYEDDKYDHKSSKKKFVINENAEQLLKEINIERTKEWDAYDNECNVAAKKYAEQVASKFENKKLFLFSYSDNGGQVLLEHGDIFSNLPHIRVSHH